MHGLQGLHKIPLLPVIRPLVLQPTSVARDTSDLLAVVIRHGVRERLRRGVDAELLDTRVELLFFLHHQHS